MAKQPRHPYVALRWFAAGLLAVGLINWIKDLAKTIGRVLDGELGAGWIYEAAFAHPMLWFVAFGGAWLVTLLRPSRATPWLTSFILLCPYAWLISGLIFLSLPHFVRGKFIPEAFVAQVVFAGLVYAYHRFAWMWWWTRRREIIKSEP